MKKKEFKAESKKLMDLMINSIYTNKEIFLREIISNSSDALDKLYYNSLTDKKMKVDKDKLAIHISLDKEKKTMTISDNGIGMTKEELENNLGTIAKSGSEEYKKNNKTDKDNNIIGQFGVGFYSTFMVSSKVDVISKSYGSEESYQWSSTGIDGYTIEPAQRDTVGTDVILTLREDTESEKYSDYLEDYTIERLVKKYSDYITYPIKMEVTTSKLKEKKNKEDKDEYESVKEIKTLNDLVPIWKRNKSEVEESEYNTFYKDKFMDYEDPILRINTNAEGLVSYESLLYIPSHAPYDFYTKEYEKGLQLYSNGVLIMEKCSDLIPDYFGFIKGVVDSPDLPLNISRETIQQNRVLKTIASSIENKVKKELLDLLTKDRSKYETFFKEFGMQIKYGIYSNFGMNKDSLQDLLIFVTSKDKKYMTLKEYISNLLAEQKDIYYACGETIDKIDMNPQVEALKEKGYNIIYCTDAVDEFALKTLREYEKKEFKNVGDVSLDLGTEEEKESLKKENEENKDLLKFMKETLSDVSEVKFTNHLSNHPVCLSSTGEISVEMEKALGAIPNNNQVKASKVLEINMNHEIASKLKNLYQTDKEELKKMTKVLYAEARLIEGLPIDNPTEISNIIVNMIAK